MPDNQIGLEAVFEDADFQAGISSYNSSVKDSTSETESGASAMSAAWEGLSAVGAIAFAAIAAGVAAMAAELYVAVEAAMEAEDVLARMEFVVGNVGERTGVTTDEVLALADSLSQVVPIDDEVITSAITMGLTFDGVTKDNIEPLIKAAADLAIWTGKDLPATMKELSLAISDPDRAMRLFRDANITLTDEEKKAMKAMGDLGDTAGVTEFILAKLAEKGIIGLGEAMGDTAKGKMTIMQTMLGNLQEALGSGLLDSLSGVFDRISEFASDPATIAFFTDLGTQIGQFAKTILDNIPDIMTTIEGLSTWFVENKPLIVGVLAAIGVAMLAFGYTVAAAGLAAMAGLWPVVAVMAVVGVAAALLYTAWTENWGGIQEQTAAIWAVLQPIFDMLIAWLAVNVPIALQALSDFWTLVLLPAIQIVFAWIVTNLVPLFISIVEWLSVNIPLAIATLSAFWTGTLLPAITAVWGWISTNLIPLFEAVGRLMSVVLTLAITALAGLWQNVLLPAITAVGDWISAHLIPVFEAISNVVTGTVLPALRPFADFLSDTLHTAFAGISSIIQTVIGWVNKLTEALAKIKLPAALTPGSPTPFELGLRGINDQLGKLAKATLPAVTHQMNVLATVRDVPGSSSGGGLGQVINSSETNRNYLFGAQFNVNSQSALIDILNGLA